MLKQVLFVFILFFLGPICIPAQQKDSSALLADTVLVKDSSIVEDSITLADSAKFVAPTGANRSYVLNRIITENGYLNSQSQPLAVIETPRKKNSKDALFYSLAMVVFLFALLKFLYARYFSNLFRVFFNTSLRQGQLTDQLLQAKLPSLLYNLFFILMGSWYLYVLLNFFGKLGDYDQWQILLLAATVLIMIYLVKFSILKFTGWITGFRQEADTYIFIVFLINKIVAICLIPLVIVMAFSDKELAHIAIILSFVVIGVMLLMRFFRSYSLLQNRLKVSRFHFFVYILGIEIVPLLVIYKGALLFMTKNL
ncbi:hypothetical protein BH11BAC4_BH11BAC4_10080 [soil metagenome]